MRKRLINPSYPSVFMEERIVADVSLVCTHRGTGLTDPTVVELGIRLRAAGESERTAYLSRWRSEKLPGDTDILYAMLCRLFDYGTESVGITHYSLTIAHSAAVPVKTIMGVLSQVLEDRGYRAVVPEPEAARRWSFARWLGEVVLRHAS